MADLKSNALVTLDDAKRYLKIEESSRDDDRVIQLINEVSTHAENFCRRSFLKATYTAEEYDGDGSTVLFLNNYPIVSIASITPYEGAGALTVKGTEFNYNADSGEVRLLGGRVFSSNFRQTTVTYDAGYDTEANLPDDLSLAIKLAVAMRYNEQSKKTYNVTRQDMGGDGGTVEYISEIYPKLTLEIWNRYRRRVYG